METAGYLESAVKTVPAFVTEALLSSTSDNWGVIETFILLFYFLKAGNEVNPFEAVCKVFKGRRDGDALRDKVQDMIQQELGYSEHIFNPSVRIYVLDCLFLKLKDLTYFISEIGSTEQRHFYEKVDKEFGSTLKTLQEDYNSRRSSTYILERDEAFQSSIAANTASDINNSSVSLSTNAMVVNASDAQLEADRKPNTN
mmetsp:Transcript_12380/g.16059  ORF Transcript_12380/g.16059 Transcript_12380/m.16059 type:complete len:199 (+) Transcript_12380:395-991(+)